MKEQQISRLASQVENGDQKAFEKLYEETKKTVYFICISFLNNEEDAKDVMQDVYLTAYNKIAQLNDKGKFVPWINQIAVNKCKKFLMKKTPIMLDSEDLGELTVEENENFLPEEYIAKKEKRKIVMDIMRNYLSDVQYQTVILYYFNNLTIDEVADIMECPPGTVKYRLSVARGKIKEGVLKYENQTEDKLYSAGGAPFLASLLAAEMSGLDVPGILPEVLASLSGNSAAGVVNNAGASAAAGAVTGTAARKGIGALFATVKAKIIAAAVAVAAIGGGIALALTHSDKSDLPKVVYESEYMKIEYKGARIETQGYMSAVYDIPDGEEGEVGVLYLDFTVTNKTDEPILTEQKHVGVNGMTHVATSRDTGDSYFVGENELTIRTSLESMKDYGEVDISSVSVDILTKTNGIDSEGNPKPNEYIERAYFECELEETLTFENVPSCNVEELEVVYSDDSIEIRVEKVCGHNQSQDDLLYYGTGYVYNKTDKTLRVNLQEDVSGDAYILPGDYSKFALIYDGNIFENNTCTVTTYVDVDECYDVFEGPTEMWPIGSLYVTDAFSYDVECVAE